MNQTMKVQTLHNEQYDKLRKFYDGILKKMQATQEGTSQWHRLKDALMKVKNDMGTLTRGTEVSPMVALAQKMQRQREGIWEKSENPNQ